MEWYKEIDDELLEKLIAKYSYLVYTTRKLIYPGVWDYDSVEDLNSIGMIELIECIRQYDPTKGASPRNYFIERIRYKLQAVNPLRAKAGWRVVKDVRRIAAAKEALGVELNREPTNEELAEATGLSLFKINDLLFMVDVIRPVRCDELDDCIPEAVDPYEIVSKKELDTLLWDAVAKLNPLQHDVVLARYTEGESTRRIAKKLRCSHTYVRKVSVKGMANLRRTLEPHKEAFINV